MLKSLEVRNLGPILKAKLDDRAPVTIIFGPNEAGKSTLLESLQVLYFGTRGDIPVAGNKALVHDGEKGFAVDAVVGDVELHATRTTRAAQDDLRDVLGDPRAWRAMTDLQDFIDMKPAKRKQLLSALTTSDSSELLAMCRDLGASDDVCNAVEAGMRKKAHRLVQDARRAASTVVKALEERIGAEVEDTEVETKKGTRNISTVPIVTIEAGIQKLTAARDKALQALRDRETHSAAIERARQAREELEGLDAESSWGEGDDADLLQKQRDLRAERDVAGAASLEYDHITQVKGPLESLIEEGGDCPTCGTPLSQAGPAIKKSIQAHESRMLELRKVQKESAAKQKTLEKELKALQERQTAASRNKTYRERLRAAIERGDGLEIPDAPKAKPEELMAEIQRLQSMRDVRRDYENAKELKAKAEEAIEGRRETLAGLIELDEVLDPTRIDDQDGLLEQLDKLLAQTCSPLGVDVAVNPDYSLSIAGRDPSLGADSARLRAGFGVACALAVLSGVGIVCLDRFEALDGANRKRVLGVCKKLTDEGLIGTVLIAAVKDNQEASSKVPWLAYAKLEDGTLKYL